MVFTLQNAVCTSCGFMAGHVWAIASRIKACLLTLPAASGSAPFAVALVCTDKLRALTCWPGKGCLRHNRKDPMVISKAPQLQAQWGTRPAHSSSQKALKSRLTVAGLGEVWNGERSSHGGWGTAEQTADLPRTQSGRPTPDQCPEQNGQVFFRMRLTCPSFSSHPNSH